MNRALWLLLSLQMRGWLRYLRRNVQTVRGALLALVGFMVFLPWLLAVFSFPGGGGIDSTSLGRYGPATLLLYCIANVLFSSQERAIYFTPAEVQMLFAGPFGRREVLFYKILLTLLVSLPATLLMAAIIRLRDGWPPAVLSGLLLLGIFMQLFGMALSLLADAAGASLYSRGRKIVAGLAVLLVVAMVSQAGPVTGTKPARLLQQAFETSTWRIASWPFQSFFDAMRATRLSPDLLVPLATGATVDLVLVALICLLDSHYQEASAAASARIYARLQRMRGRSAGAESTRTRTRKGWFDVPDLPFCGGVGPILWRQLTTSLRGLGRLVFVLLILCGALALPLMSYLVEGEVDVMPSLAFLGVWISIFLTGLVPFDFRGDIDRIGILKTLPIASWRLTIGQLLTPVLLLSTIQLLAMMVGWMLSSAHREWIVAAACFVLPINFILVALDNLLFLLFPVRLAAATPGDFMAVGRNVLLSFGKIFGLIITCGTAAIVGAIVYLITQFLHTQVTWLADSAAWLVAAASAWVVVAAIGCMMIPMIAVAFNHFDVGRDTPA